MLKIPLYYKLNCQFSWSKVSFLCSFLQLHHVEVVKWHQVSVSSEDKECAIRADLGGVAVASAGGDRDDAAAYIAWRPAHLRRPRHSIAHAVHVPQLSLLHLLVVRIEALVGILDNETGLHGHGGR